MNDRSLDLLSFRPEIPSARVSPNMTNEEQFQNQDWGKALRFYERYSVIDPSDEMIRQKMMICREKLTAKVKTAKAPIKKKKEDKNKKVETLDKSQSEIKRILEESGSDSKWIMKYLFEDDKGVKNSETPW